MTTKQADKLIADRKLITVKSKYYDEQFTVVFNRRTRFNIYTVDGGCFDRKDLELVKEDTES